MMNINTNKKDTSWTELFSNMDKGTYYQDISKGRRILIRVSYVVLFACSVALFFIGAVKFAFPDLGWYIIVIEALSVFFMIRMIAALISYLLSPRVMTYTDYNKSSFGLERSSLWGAICIFILAILTIIYTAINNLPFSSNLVSALMFLGAAAAMTVVTIIERKIVYVRIPEEPEDK